MLRFTISYEQTDYSVNLAIQAHNAPNVEISVMHESVIGTLSYDMTGNETITIPHCQDKETLILIARYHADIIASAILTIETAAIPDGYALQQIALHNALIEQCETTRLVAPTPPARSIEELRPTDADLEDLLAIIEAAQVLEAAMTTGGEQQ